MLLAVAESRPFHLLKEHSFVLVIKLGNVE